MSISIGSEIIASIVRHRISATLDQSDLIGGKIDIRTQVDFLTDSIRAEIEAIVTKTTSIPHVTLTEHKNVSNTNTEEEGDWVPVDGWNYIKQWFVDRFLCYLRWDLGIHVEYRPMLHQTYIQVVNHNTLHQTVNEYWCPHLKNNTDKEHFTFLAQSKRE